MRTGMALVFCGILVASGFGQGGASQSSTEVLRRELNRLRAERAALAADQDAVARKMLTGVALEGVKQLGDAFREFVNGYKLGNSYGELNNAIQSGDGLKAAEATGKLSAGIFDITFKGTPWKTGPLPMIVDEVAKALQLGFLTRAAAELESRIAATQLLLAKEAVRDVKLRRDWERTYAALHESDLRLQEEFRRRLAPDAGQEFARGLLQDARSISTSLAQNVAQGLEIVSPNEDIWKLSDIPEINPDFLRALECERRAMNEWLSTYSNAALVKSYGCRRRADGSYVPAFSQSGERYQDSKKQPSPCELEAEQDSTPTAEECGSCLYTTSDGKNGCTMGCWAAYDCSPGKCLAERQKDIARRLRRCQER